LGFWKDAWNRGVLAWATDAIRRRQGRRNIRRLAGKLARQKGIVDAARFKTVSMGVLAVRQDFITKSSAR